jgi:hypothetical protein
MVVVDEYNKVAAADLSYYLMKRSGSVQPECCATLLTDIEASAGTP